MNLVARSMLFACALLAPLAAQAVVVYQFSLPANGDVGPIVIRQTVDDYLPVGELAATPLTDPSVAFVSGTPLDASDSVFGFAQSEAETQYGLALIDPDEGLFVLLTRDYPDDFFRFARTFDQEGIFQSAGGLVESELALASTEPIATLCVSSTGACARVVPEPATLVILGLGLVGLGGLRRRKA